MINKDKLDQLQSIIDKWVLNQEDPQLNLNLAECYRSMDQQAAAFSHYMKVYEMNPDIEARYYCIMSIAEIYHSLGNRWEGVIHHCRLAKSECPDRPEAYYLLAYVQADRLMMKGQKEAYDWDQVYENARIGLLYAEGGFDKPKSKFYDGINALRWLYILGCIKLSKLVEAKKYISDIDITELPEYAKNQVYEFYDILNINNPYISYSAEKDGKLNFELPEGIEYESNAALSFEDLFVGKALNNKHDCYVLELGIPKYSNTQAIPKRVYGIAIDPIDNKSNQYNLNSHARNVFAIDSNPLAMDYSDLIDQHYPDGVDYLQFAFDEGLNKQILYKIPWDDHEFKVITYIHNSFNGNDSFKEVRKFLRSKGYKLVYVARRNVTDLFEDWYINPKYVDENDLNIDIQNKDIKSQFLIH